MKNNIKKILREKDITQNELAQITGLDKSTISRYVNFNRIPRGENILKIMKALNVSIDELFKEEK